jgi:exopolysaccharide biosynthesis polyprenyl glycosylphosphotransferase
LRWRLAAADTAMTAIAFETAYVLRQHLPALRLFYLDGPTMAGLFAAVLGIWLVSGSAIGNYRSPDPSDVGRTIRGILRQAGWSTAILVGLLYLLKLSDISRLFMSLFVVLNVLLLLTWRLLAPALVRAATGDSAKRYYVIVGTGDRAAQVARLIEGDGDRSAEVLAFIRDHAAAEDESGAIFQQDFSSGGSSRVRELSALAQTLRTSVVDEVIFASDRPGPQQLDELFQICEEEGVKVRVMVSIFRNTPCAISLDRLHDLPMLTYSTSPDNDYLLFLKRILDVSVGVSMAIVLSPFSLLVMLAIRLSSKGPIFFVQERCGLNGRHFRLYKFRSMHEDAQSRRASVASLNEMDGPVFKCSNDPRVTRLGRFLRKFSVDEWPQLINVIRGDMSLVGPRPPLPEEVEQYKLWHRRRLRMRPGLTCLWVLAGRNKLDFFNWMRLDMQYIDHWSLALDCKILLWSIPHVVSGKGM